MRKEILLLIPLLLWTGCAQTEKAAAPSKSPVAANAAPTSSPAEEEVMKRRETEHFVFYTGESDAAYLDGLERQLEAGFERITADLGHSLTRRTPVYIYPTVDAFHEAVGRPNAPDWYIGEGSDGVISIVSPRHMRQNAANVLCHEFTHILSAEIGPMPQWLFQGIAMHEGQETPYDQVENSLRSGVRSGTVPSIDQMSGTYEGFTEVNGYPYAYSLVRYIMRSYGMDKLTLLLHQPNNVQGILGITRDELNEAWMSDLEERYK